MEIILITGASSGIGRSTVIEFAKSYPNAKLVLVARREDQLKETAKIAGLSEDRYDIFTSDLSKPNSAKELAEYVANQHGKLDVLVNNAGLGSPKGFERPDAIADIDTLIDVNLRAPIKLIHYCLPLLEKSQGVVVNVGSVAGLVGQPNSPVYAATKWAITGLSASLNARFTSSGVYVACVMPGPVPTSGWSHTRLTSRWYARPLYCTPSTIAKAIVKASKKRAIVSIRPRMYAAIPILNSVFPRVTRLALNKSVKSGWNSEGL